MPMISLTAADGHRLSAYRTGPQNAARALVVVQEIFGVNRHMRNVADRFAAEGYAVIAPALFDRVAPGIELGYEAADVAQGRELRGRIQDGLTVLDILAAAAALPRGVKRGIVGYCWGGTVTWHGATRTSAFGAASCWYGGGIAAAKDEQPRCPVQMHFGETDASIPMSDVDAIRTAQPGVEVHVYAGAGHGFGCDERGSFSAKDAAVAQRRTLEFFGKNL
ncbi:dienelactone hydrolase family protein [Roseomonas eburnea]|uniref:Dienelactone hydrolase family protein n=2 Tax=Neoroseomonas eburnea TaxID=1346889 RepID=A0A9X9XCT2_9PROT|nr:dienelactone hydrolase family protein [Neoroseomonas eburnea]MBR0681518.1 dienelactone hydrolase family protein [Neoroseomonas eburnea]